MRHRRALAAVIVALMITGGAVTMTWRWLGEQRRLGDAVGRLVAHRTGLPVTIGAVDARTHHVVLHDVRVGAQPFDLRVGRLDVTGALGLLTSTDAPVEIVASSASVTLAASGVAPRLDVLRAHALSLLDWPGRLRLTMLGGAMESGGRRFVFDLTGEKRAEGDIVVALAVRPLTGRTALRVDTRARAGRAGAVHVGVELAGEPRRLAGLWPQTLPPPARVGWRGDVIVAKGGDAEASGRMTLGGSATLAIIDGIVRYDPRTRVVAAPRYVLTRADGVHLEGDGVLEPDGTGRRIVARATGAVDGARVQGRVRYDVSSGVFDGEASMRGGTMRSLWKRLDLPGEPPEQASVAVAQARFSGVDRVAGLSVDVDATADGVRLARWPALPVEATVKAALRVASAAHGLTLASISHAVVTVAREGRPLAVVNGASRGSALWPVSVDARIADAGRLSPWLPLEPTLAGRARLTGELQASAFAGDLVADLASATVMLGAPVTLTNVRAALPVRWQSPAAGSAGSVSVERAAGYGFVAHDISSPATFADGRLVMADVQYRHYGGRGAGTLEASTHAPLRFAARMVGDGVDLASFVREAGVTIARATGRVDYVMFIQQTQADGLFMAGRIDGEADGGEIGIDAIERLLASSTTDADGSGLMRRTLENLRIFRYDSLAADVRLTGATGYVDVALKGRKRLGIFPGRVDAINLHHVPLDVLARTFAKGQSP